MSLRGRYAPSVALAAILVSLFSPVSTSAKDAASAGALFRQRCASCHTVPDPREPFDAAWLEQVNHTA